MGRRGPPDTAAALVITLVVLAAALFVAFGLGFGGYGMAHFIGGTAIAAGAGILAMLGRRR